MALATTDLLDKREGIIMIWMIGGYIWLFLHRPFEFYHWLGDIRIERVYMISTLVVWLLAPGKGWSSNRLHKAMLIFTLAIICCWFASPFNSALGEKVWEEHYKVGVLYLLIVTTVNDEKKLKQLMTCVFASLMLYQLHSLWEFFNGRYEFRQGIARLLGIDKTAGDPNSFSASLLHMMPFLIPFWMSSQTPRMKKLIVFYLLVNLLCIYLTGSRRAYIGVALMLCIVVWQTEKRWTYFTLMFLMAPIVFMMMRSDLQDRLLTIFNPSGGPNHAASSARFRLDALFYGFDIFGRSPLTGTGPSTFALASKTGLQAHNLYAQVMAEMGMLGIVSLIVLVWCFWKNTTEVKRLYAAHPWWECDFTYYMVRATWLAVFLLMFMGIGGHNMFRYNWLWFAAFQICAVQIVRKRAAEEEALRWQPVEPVHYRVGLQYAM